MDKPEDQPASPAREVVFVLRLRPGVAGWRGQVQRLAEDQRLKPPYISSTFELYMLLDSEWQWLTNSGSPAPLEQAEESAR